MEDNIQIKQTLYKACLKIIETRILEIESRLNSIQESRNNETKSSVGDKYETGRSMMQLEEENFNFQLAEAKKVKNDLSLINFTKALEKTGPGSLVITSNGAYFMSIGIGRVKLDQDLFYCVSSESPMGKLLRNKKAGDAVVFNETKIIIDRII